MVDVIDLQAERDVLEEQIMERMVRALVCQFCKSIVDEEPLDIQVFLNGPVMQDAIKAIGQRNTKSLLCHVWHSVADGIVDAIKTAQAELVKGGHMHDDRTKAMPESYDPECNLCDRGSGGLILSETVKAVHGVLNDLVARLDPVHLAPMPTVEAEKLLSHLKVLAVQRQVVKVHELILMGVEMITSVQDIVDDALASAESELTPEDAARARIELTLESVHDMLVTKITDPHETMTTGAMLISVAASGIVKEHIARTLELVKDDLVATDSVMTALLASVETSRGQINKAARLAEQHILALAWTVYSEQGGHVAQEGRT